MKYWFTADEHYGHANIIKYCNRPFKSVEAMDLHIMLLHNEVVAKDDVVIHAGDFCWCNNMRNMEERYLQHLRGTHIFIRGSHDHWMPNSFHWMWTKMIEKQYVVVCHYAMRTWPRSHYNSWQLYGHSHGRLGSMGKQYDIGVDNNNFYPVSWEKIVVIMKDIPDNYVKERR